MTGNDGWPARGPGPRLSVVRGLGRVQRDDVLGQLGPADEAPPFGGENARDQSPPGPQVQGPGRDTGDLGSPGKGQELGIAVVSLR